MNSEIIDIEGSADGFGSGFNRIVQPPQMIQGWTVASVCMGARIPAYVVSELRHCNLGDIFSWVRSAMIGGNLGMA